MKFFKHLIWLLLLPVTGPSLADAEVLPFQTFTAHYRGEANGLEVEELGYRSLEALEDQRYRLRYEASAMIYKLEETSVFSWDGQPRPHAYDSSRGTFLNKRQSRLRFDWASGLGRYRHKDKKGEFELQPGLQDPLTSLLLLAAEIQSGKREVSMLEAKGDDREVRRFVLLDQPEIDTKLGKLKTYHVQRLHDDEDRHTELWLHHEYPFILVRVEQDDEGDRFLLELTGFELTQ
ncbi:MAG: DUF3108 domain-containing protein [Pseudomonadota bacterium]|nr:DUF3108 domain-containing protein [Pseudomonadota bacterium]